MNYKNAKTDSGNYVNGVYTSRNGFSSGLNCPRGTRLYNTELIQPIFFIPKERGETEEFRMITDEAAPGVMPYYAISNYGRVLNTRSGQIMKPQYKPSGYEYYCLASNNPTRGQTKYNVHRVLMLTFDNPEKYGEDPSKLQVNHINGNKHDNYINKTMPDGSIQSNLEWITPSENIVHKYKTGLASTTPKLSFEEAQDIRNMHDAGYSYEKINKLKYTNISYATIQLVCENRLYTDPNYIPIKDAYKLFNPANVHKLTDVDCEKIKLLRDKGFSYNEIQQNFYPDFSIATISDICRGKTHNS